MNRFCVFLIYNLLLPVVLLIGFPRFLIKGVRRGGLGRNFWQRLGFYGREIREQLSHSGEGNIWVHAVSVGEVLVALNVIRSLAEKEPDRRFVLSTTTTTGFAIAEKEAGESVTVIHNPVDLPCVVGRTIRQIRPVRLVLVEAEVWPNLVRKVRAAGVSVTLVNARLSSRSERRFRKFSALTRPIFQMLDRVCVPFETDIARWEALGVDRNRIELTGSVKFDEAVAEKPGAQIDELRGWLEGQGIDTVSMRILLAGSTHAGEESLIGRAWLALRERFPGLIYIAVPRHAERARSAAADLAAAGIAPILKNAINGSRSPGDSDPGGPACFIANTTGELRAWYHLAEVVVIGKSLVGRGGQNPVEPILAGVPVVAGPHMGNFTAIVESLAKNEGLVQLADAEVAGLTEALGRLFEEPDEAAKIAKRGRMAIDTHLGSSKRTAGAILATERADHPPNCP